MSTNINITVDSSNLTIAAKLFQEASRQFKQQKESEKILESKIQKERSDNLLASSGQTGQTVQGGQTSTQPNANNNATGRNSFGYFPTQPYRQRRPAANRIRGRSYRVEARLDIEAITLDQMIFQLAVRYGYGNSTTGTYNWAEESRTVTINGVADGFREPEMPPAAGRAFGGNTRADILLLCGVENSAAPFSSLVPSVVLVVKAESYWGVWIPNPGFDFPWTIENYEIDLSQKIVVGTENPAFSEQIAEFEAAPYVTQFITLFDSDAALVGELNYTTEL